LVLDVQCLEWDLNHFQIRNEKINFFTLHTTKSYQF